MTRILLSLISAFSVLFAFGARPVVNQELRHVGEVLWQQPCTAEFTLTNKDKTPLRIASMHVSCGCLQAKASSDIIPSGGSATIRLTYDALQMGTFHKEVAVRFEGNDTPLWLAMEGRVVRERLVVDTLLPVNFGNVRLSTANIEFEHVNRGDRPVQEIEIINTERGNYTPALMHLPPYLTAEYVPEVLRGGERGIIRLTLNSEQLPDYGLNQTTVYLSRYHGERVSDENELQVSTILLPSFSQFSEAQLSHAPRMQLSSDNVVMEGINDKKKLTAVIVVSNTGDTPLSIKQLQVSHRSVGVSLGNRTVAPGASTKLKITLTPSMLKTSRVRPRILLITDDPTHAAQTINIIPK